VGDVFVQQFHALLVVYALYVVATASPGPSNMAIMGIAMRQGRLPALAFTAGVMTGSISWALLAATGISTLLAAYANAIFAIKIGGGLYLLYLGWKSARSAMRPTPLDRTPSTDPVDYGKLYRRGLMMHLTNPKSILSWIAIMSLGLQSDAPGHTTLAIILGCAVLGIAIFGGYAMLFSTEIMVRLYQKARRWIEATLALFFGLAGVRLLMARL
jgi:threonine/homoserine/homoserine lactone efflux protein